MKITNFKKAIPAPPASTPEVSICNLKGQTIEKAFDFNLMQVKAFFISLSITEWYQRQCLAKSQWHTQGSTIISLDYRIPTNLADDILFARWNCQSLNNACQMELLNWTLYTYMCICVHLVNCGWELSGTQRGWEGLPLDKALTNLRSNLFQSISMLKDSRKRTALYE